MTPEGIAETRVRVFDPALPVAHGITLDLNEDGLADFEIEELVHTVEAQEVSSMRLVGLTHIIYDGPDGENPTLLRARYQGILSPFDRVPGSPAEYLVFDTGQIVVGEFLRVEMDPSGGKTLRGLFDEFGRCYLGVSVETVPGVLNGWIEVTVVDGSPVVTAIGYESEAGGTATVGGLPLETAALCIRREGEVLVLMWAWAPGTDYRVEESSDLRSWTPLAAGLWSVDSSTGLATLETLHGSERRFYRLVGTRQGVGS